jgi:hypothetical protein
MAATIRLWEGDDMITRWIINCSLNSESSRQRLSEWRMPFQIRSYNIVVWRSLDPRSKTFENARRSEACELLAPFEDFRIH